MKTFFSLKKFVLTGLMGLIVSLSAVAGQPAKPAGTLHMVTVGIDEIPGQHKLKSCKKDARDMVEWAQSQKGTLAVNVDLANPLLEANATRANILNAFKGLRDKSRPGDLTIIGLSSHGMCGRNGEFFLATYDGQLSWSEIKDVLSGVQGKVIVMIDACQCGSATAANNMIVHSSSLKSQSSWPGAAGQNSLFTKLYLEGLHGAADFNHDGVITLSELETYVSNRLAEMDKGQTMTTTRAANVPSSMPVGFVTTSPVTTSLVSTQTIQQVASLDSASTVRNFADMSFTGSEKIPNSKYGKLRFEFGANGKVVMIDAANRIEGTYKPNGNNVTITIPGACTYSGSIDGTTLSGNGFDNTRTWPFSVSQDK